MFFLIYLFFTLWLSQKKQFRKYESDLNPQTGFEVGASSQSTQFRVDINDLLDEPNTPPVDQRRSCDYFGLYQSNVSHTHR